MSSRTMSGLLVVVLALPGCLSQEGAPAAADLASPSVVTGAAPFVAANLPPVANLSAEPAGGAAPLRVNFTISVSDENADDLVWGLDADADGLPDARGNESVAQANFTYESEGVYNATLNVTDGTDTATVTVQVSVTRESDPPPGRANGSYVWRRGGG